MSRIIPVLILLGSMVAAGTGIGFPSSAYAQNGSLPTDVWLTAGPTVIAGETFTVTVQGTASMYTPQLEVNLPSGLVAEDVLLCQATSYVIVGTGTAQQDLGCNAGVEAGPNGTTRFVAWPLAYGGVGVNKLFASFTVRVPQTSPIGATYTLSAQTAGYNLSATVTVTVIGEQVQPPIPTRPAVEATQPPPRASATLIPGGADADAPLVFIPTSINAHPGDKITFDVDFVRLQGINSVSVWIYAENMVVTNVPRHLVDPYGTKACSMGSDTDALSPSHRAFDLYQSSESIPTQMDLVLTHNESIGSQLHVCMEMVIFAGDREMGSWNALATVNVIAP